MEFLLKGYRIHGWDERIEEGGGENYDKSGGGEELKSVLSVEHEKE